MPDKSLKEATLTGVRWVMLARVVTDVLALGVVVVLARLIPPAEFGRAAVALILVPLAVILTYEGFASALVQRETIDENHRRAAAFTAVIGGGALTLLIAVLAHPVGDPLFGPETARLIAIMSPAFLVASMGAVPRALLLRRLDFRRVSVIEVIALVVGNVVALVLAMGGLDAQALVLGALATTTTASVLLFASVPPPRPGWHRASQRQISAFGIPAALAGLVHVMFNNVDYAILATRISAAQTGIYWRAFNLGVVYQQKVSGVMMQVAFPVYSRTESREELRQIHARATRLLAAIVFPLLALLAVIAPVLVPFAFGARWEPAVVPTQILAFAGMTAALLTGYPQVMLAVGRPKALLRFNIGMLGTYATAIALAAPAGLAVVSVTAVAVHVVILVAVYHLLLRPCLGTGVRALIDHIRPAVGACVALAAGALSVRQALTALDAPDLVMLAGVSAAGVGSYAIALRALFRPTWDDARDVAVRVVPQLDRLAVRLRGARAASAPAR
jgi:lipopolysaccharide exporter